MNEIEENEYDSIVSILQGMKFYDIYSFSTNFGVTTFCTYRDQKQVEEVFDNRLNIVKLVDPDIIMDAFHEDGIFCIELHNNYKTLKSLAEDLIVSRISGMMDREMEPCIQGDGEISNNIDSSSKK